MIVLRRIYRKGPLGKIRTLFTYTQGQYNPDNPKIREYFYFIDHNGMLFLDDSRMKNFTSCFKEQQFLSFFFRNVRQNKYDYISTFPFVSLCGIERNYIRCDDTPIVFTQLKKSPSDDTLKLHLNYADNLSVPFSPEELIVQENGRVYHPFTSQLKHQKSLLEFALVRSQLVMNEFKFKYENEKPIGLELEGKTYLFSSRTTSSTAIK